MIGDIGHKIGVAAVGFAHHAVFVIAKIRGAQPQRTAFFVGVPHFAQARHGLFHRACSVQRRLKKIVVESHTKRLQIQILLAAQIRHRKITHSIQIINVFLRGHAVDGFTCKVGVGNIDDVITAIAALRKRRIVHAQTLATRLHRNRQIGNLLTRVIVVKLAVYVVALTAQHRAENIAERGLTRMPHVQRSRWIGRDKFEHHALTVVRIRPSKRRTLLNDRLHHRLFGGIGQTNIDKARTRNFQSRNQRIGGHRIDNILRQFTRIFTQRFGQLHGDIARRIAVRDLLGTLQDGRCRGIGRNTFKC